MKILAIRLKNINSFKGEHVIDFEIEPFISSKIFAITGVTGSGKSTLLDVITLALYHRIPRVGAINKSEIENKGVICTQNIIDESYAEVEYLAQNKRYRSKWSISYTRNKTLRSPEMEVACVTDDNEILATRTDVIAKNTAIIGLDFDQFVKSILLSQGEFARLLQSDENERGKLLEKITGKDIYRHLGKFSFEREKEERLKLEAIQQKIKQIQLLLPEQVNEFQEKTKELKGLEKEVTLQNQEFLSLISIKKDIQQKEQKIAIEQEKLKAVQEKIKEFEGKKELVFLAEKMQVERERYRQLQEKVQEEKTITTKIQRIQNEINDCVEKIEVIQNGKDKEDQELQILKEHQLKYDPIFKKVRELNQEIKQKEEEYKQKQSAFLKEQNDFEEFEISLKKDEVDFVIKRKQLAQITQELTKDQVLEKVAQDIPQLTQLEKDLKIQLEHFKNQVQIAQQKIKENNIEFPSFINPQRFNLFVQKQLAFFQNNKVNPVDSKLIKEIDERITQKEELYRTTQHIFLRNSEVYKKANVEIEKNKQSSIVLNNVIQQLKKNLEEVQFQLIIEKKAFHEIQLEKSKLENEALYEQARTELKDGENCPLCGSEEHPYVKHYEKTLDVLVDKFKKYEESQAFLQKQIIDLTKELATQEQEQKYFSENLQKQEQVKEEAFNEFKKAVNELITIDEITETSVFWQTQLNSLKEAILGLRALKEQDKKHQIFENNQAVFIQLNEYVQIILETEKRFNTLIERYKNINLVNFSVQKLQELAVSYENKKQEKQQLENTCLVLEERCKNEKKRLIDKQKVVFTQKNLLNSDQKIIQEKEKERDNHLVKNPDEAEKRLQKKLSDTEQNIKKLEIGINQQQTIKKEKERNLIELEQEKSSVVKRNDLEKSQLNTSLSNYGITLDQIGDYQLSSDEIEQIKKQGQLLEQEETKSKQTIYLLKEECTTLKVNQTQEFVEEELNSLVKTNKEHIEVTQKELAKIEHTLEQDEINRKQNKQLFDVCQVQEKEYTRWKELHSIIGDSKGDNFAKFAQELTFLHLIQLANQRLDKLDSRYKLKLIKLKEKDEVVVIDSYQANAQRSISTLSGGETFLVSLAMALGLSDMASRNVKIESLFIDEGFGTLDEDTLDSALSTLENLQVQSNRTIAIISHVASLKERIQTQIQMSKNSSGFSKIKVI